MVSAVVTDIEGTTSSIAFVHEVLFPYARRELPAFLRANHQLPEVAEQLAAVNSEVGRELTLEDAIEQLLAWIAEDRKVTALKALQGLVWEHGYQAGTLKGHVYADAVAGLRRWHEAGLSLYVYSSGSVHAQKLLFGFSEAGDLTPLFSGYFDTRIGHKREANAYRAILAQLALPGGEVLFLSDIVEELDAAAAAGMQTGWLVREGSLPEQTNHPVYADFTRILAD